ncbi:MAG TPA: DUF4388 domain-containing protein [Candidatus Krumholzibacteria bacterium]|nr:DUF4388 domain-containing protein [Candidatus Krumholzibacteria bacterium]
MQGALQEFGLAEILQLVAMQHKTGLLRVESYDKLLTFYFDKGMLVSCRDRRRIGDDPLLEFMKKTGYLDAWQTLHLTLEVEENKKDVADVLLDKRLLTPEELRQAVLDMTQDLVFRTYNWKEGTYRFLGGDDSLRGLSHTVGLKMEAVLLEAARRVDEWPHILTKLPSPQALLAPITTLPTSLDERSQTLLSKLRSPMRLAELVACGRLPEYEVYEIVAAAVDAGLTSILEMPRPVEIPKAAPVAAALSTPAPRPVPRRRLGLGLRAMPQPSILFWALALIALGCALMILGLRDGGSRAARTEIEVYTARATLQRDLETYRALQGRYPASLQELADMQLTSPSVVVRAGVVNYTRGARGKSFDLDYTGADKKR